MEAPRVAIDLRIADAAGTERTGLGRYALELARELPAARPGWTFAIHSNRDDLPGGPGVEIHRTRWPTSSGAGRVSWLHLGSAAAMRPAPDVLFAPYPALPVWWQRPSVVTIHDLVPILMPERYRGKANSAYASWMLRRAAGRADRVLCGSMETRTLLVERLGMDDRRVAVTRYGVAERFFSVRRAQPRGPGFLLFVGTLEPRKGLDVLHRALREVNAAGAEMRLVAAGNPGWGTGSLVAELEADPLVEIVEGASDEQLARLYGEALALAYPSRMEGFGLPVAEAIAAGCPVIASNLGCIQEFAGEAPRYVRPGEAEDLTTALFELRAGPEEFRQRADSARAAVEGLRWPVVAEETAVEIERALG